MIGIVTKIHEKKVSRNGNDYIRVEFDLDNGQWAKTDLCPDFRNYKNWLPVLVNGVGTKVYDLEMRRINEVNADSKIFVV